VTIDPNDDWWIVAELLVDGEPELLRDKVRQVEDNLALNVVHAIIDPNMGRSQAHNAGRRHVTVADEFAAVGIRCDDSVSNDFAVGRTRVANRLKPDQRTRRPRLHVFRTCPTVNSHFNKFTWDEWARYSSDTRDPKPRPRELFDDFPKLLGYLANYNPTYSGLYFGNRIIHREGRRAAY